MRRNQRKCVIRYLAALAADSTPDPPTYDVNPDHEMSDFIHFKSEEEVRDLERGVRKKIQTKDLKFELPKSPEIPEEEFERIQRRVTRKSLGQTLEEYESGARPRHGIPEEILEATAEDLRSDDELEDSSDDRCDSDEELRERLEEADGSGRESRLDFVPITEEGDLVDGAAARLETATNEAFTIRSRIRTCYPPPNDSPMDATSSPQLVYDERDRRTESSHSCPERRGTETPIARRLRRLGLNDSSSSANLFTPKRRKLASTRRFLQVYGTPRRESESLDELFHPTVDLAELVKFRVVEKDPFRINFSMKPSRLEDRF